MERYINEALVNAKLKEICDNYATSYGEEYGGRAEKFARLTEDIPTAEVEEVRHGEWIYDKTYYEADECNCSLCGQLMTTATGVRMNYCPNCGARMDGERKSTPQKEGD